MGKNTLKTIFSVDGDKGGVGKSAVSMSLVDALFYNKKTIRLIEAESTNMDVGKCYNSLIKTDFLNLDEKSGFMALLEVISQCQEEYIVINNPARSVQWLDYGITFYNALSEINTTMQCLWVLGRKSDSIEALLNYYDAISCAIHPVINTYFGRQSDYEIWYDKDNVVRNLVLQKGGKEIVFPSCADRVTEKMGKMRWNWSDTDKMCFSHKIEARRFCDAARSALAPIII